MKLDLRSPRSRLLLAVAISIALHEAAAGLVPRDLWRPAPVREVVTRAQILRVSTRPAVVSTPQTAHVVLPARAFVATAPALLPKAASARHTPRATPARRPALRQPPPVAASNGRPVWDAAGSVNARALVASAAGAAGTGTAVGAGGAGAAPASDDRPCGFVTFSDPHGSQYDSRSRGFWVDIRISVRFADGTTQSMILDYPWYYSSEAANPWSDQNLRDPNFPTRFQQPPPEKAADEPPLVQYVMAHSTADGLTLLRDCPQRADGTP